MKTNFISMLIFMSLFLITSCSRNNDFEEAELKLSETSIQFAKTSSEKSVTVTTNMEKWGVLKTFPDWIKIKKEGNTLKISVSENKFANDRKTTITVHAGSEYGEIDVKQSGAEVSIATIPDKLIINEDSAEYQLEVVANTDDWKINSEEKWLTARKSPDNKKAIIVVQGNKEDKERTAKLILSKADGKSPIEVEIKQSGTTIYYLPFMLFGDGKLSGRDIVEEVKKFEKDRGSVYIGSPTSTGSEFYIFRPKNDSKSRVIAYVINDNAYRKTVIGVDRDMKRFLREDWKSYQKILEDKGFKRVENAGLVYENKEKSIEFFVEADENTVYLTYEYFPKQPKPYPTFSEFPYGINNFNARKSDVIEYEKANGGIHNDDISQEPKFSLYDIKDQDNSRARIYFFGKNPKATEEDKVKGDTLVLAEHYQLFKKIDFAYWKFGNDYTFTKEFLELVAKEGFEEVGEENLGYAFTNSDKKLKLLVRVTSYRAIDNSTDYLEIRLFEYGQKDTRHYRDNHYFRNILGEEIKKQSKKNEIKMLKRILQKY